MILFKNKIIKNIFWLLIENAVRIFLGLIITSILARKLGVEQYGLFQYSLGLVVIFSSISFICGAEVLVPSLTNSDERETKYIMGNAFVVRLFFSVIAYLLLLIFAYIMEPTESLYLISILGIVILINEAFNVVTAWLQSQTNIKPRSILYVISFSVKALLIFFLYAIDVTYIVCYGMAFIVDSLLMSIGMIYIYHYYNKSFFFQFSFDVAYSLFKKGLPFFWGLVLMFVFLRLDMLFLKKLVTPKLLGYYAASLQLLYQINAVAPIVIMSLAPRFVYCYNDSLTIKRNIKIICCIMILVAIFLSLIASFAVPYFIPLLLGKEFLPSIPVFLSLVWVSILLFLNEGLNIFLIKYGLGIYVTYKWVLVLVIAIPSYYYFIINYGVYGAIYASLLSYFVACLFGLWCYFTKGVNL